MKNVYLGQRLLQIQTLSYLSFTQICTKILLQYKSIKSELAWPEICQQRFIFISTSPNLSFIYDFDFNSDDFQLSDNNAGEDDADASMARLTSSSLLFTLTHSLSLSLIARSESVVQ